MWFWQLTCAIGHNFGLSTALSLCSYNLFVVCDSIGASAFPTPRFISRVFPCVFPSLPPPPLFQPSSAAAAEPVEYGLTQRGLLDFLLFLATWDPCHLFDVLVALGLVTAPSASASGDAYAALPAVDGAKLAAVPVPRMGRRTVHTHAQLVCLFVYSSIGSSSTILLLCILFVCLFVYLFVLLHSTR